jgi:signal transduction histidine kinase
MKTMLSNASHDLKTPLTVITGYVEALMQDDMIPMDERIKLLERVHDKSKELNGLINQFFDLAKLEADDVQIKLAPLDINEVCRQNILGFYHTISDLHLELDIKLLDQKTMIMGNEHSLNRILNNLISNAIKYGGDGKIIGILLEEDAAYIYIHIWDKGKGIPEQFIEAIFERLYTLEDSRNKNYQGSGLGLTITERLTCKMNGLISVESNPGIKTTFTLKFEKLVINK